MMKPTKRIFLHLSVFSMLVLALGGAGCASSVPKAKFTQELPVAQRVRDRDTVEAKVEAAAGVDILPSEKQRIAERLLERVRAKQAANPAREVPQAYRIELRITRYDKGSAFARSMLAGLGQIHVDGEVSVFLLPDNTRVANFELSKTFAWGGIYGGATGIEDIERTFVDGIAATLTGQLEDPAKK